MQKYIKPIILGLIVLFTGVYLSKIFDFYNLIPHIDKVYHTIGGYALGWFFYIFLLKDIETMHTVKKMLLTISLVCMVAVFWEYAERLSNLYCPTYCPQISAWFNGGDLNDTLLDILAGMTGGFIFFLLHYKTYNGNHTAL